MLPDAPASDTSRRPVAPWRDIWRVIPLSRTAATLLLSLVAAIIAFEIVLTATGVVDEPITTTLAQILVTACFALFVVHPPTAALVLLGGASLSLGSTGAEQTLLALALGVGFVLATCSWMLGAIYAAGFVGWVALVEILQPGRIAVGLLVVLLIIAAMSATVGWAVRGLRSRARALSAALATQRQEAEDVARAERHRISDELHDFIAHELTIIAMQASVLEHTNDENSRQQAQTAIRDSAKQALADIRRLLELTPAAPTGDPDTPAARLSLALTFRDVRRELSATGIRVEATGMDAAAGLSPTIDAALARLLREAATNVMKHAGPTDAVDVRLSVEDDAVDLSIGNTVGGRGLVRNLALPRGGYGLSRMTERIRVLGGSLQAGPVDDGWLVHARLPRQ